MNSYYLKIFLLLNTFNKLESGKRLLPSSKMALAAAPPQPVQSYYQSKVDELELVVREKAQNLARLTAQRNELNGRVRLLREELYALQEVRRCRISLE